MCGIAGYFGKNNIDDRKLNKSLEILRQRGPDFNRIKSYKANQIFTKLIHTRLSIIDLDPRSNQPMETDRFCLVFNGEIYNFIEIKNELIQNGCVFKTTSDTEVILKGFEYYGHSIFKKMEGMWAICIYDKIKNSIILARDRFCEKPLYYYLNNKELIFSSDIKVIKLFSNINFDINDKRLISGLVCGYKSLFKNLNGTNYNLIYSLEGASYLSIDESFKYKIVKYWKPNIEFKKYTNEKEIYEIAKKKLLHSLKIRLRSDVNIAFCLSGGVDSGALASIAAKEFNYKISSFSIIDAEDERYNEKNNIDKVVNDISSNHQEIYISDIKNNIDHLKKLINFRSGPVSTTTFYLHSFLAKAISQSNFKVSFSGNAADEIFTGYYDHHLQYLYDVKDTDYYKNALNNFEKYLRPLIRNKNFQNHNLYLDNPNYRDHIYDNYDQFTNLLNKKYLDEFKFKFKEKKFSSNLSLNRRLNELFFENTPLILSEDDSNSMYYSIENRSPYLDSELVNFMNSIETKYLIKDGYAKNILREICKGYLHEDIRLDRKKKGFNSSVTSLFDINNKQIKELIYAKENRVYNFLDYKKVINLLENENIKINHYSKFFFSLINVIIFYEDRELIG